MDWDTYFLNIACDAAKRTKCMSRTIGAVLVAQGKFIAGTGYNGPPIGVQSCDHVAAWRSRGIAVPETGFVGKCPRRLLGHASGEGLHLCPAAHAERNAIDIAARMGVKTDGCALYLTCGVPCLECAKTIIQAGIAECVVTKLEAYERRPITGWQMLQEGGVKIRMYQCDTAAILKERGLA